MRGRSREAFLSTRSRYIPKRAPDTMASTSATPSPATTIGFDLCRRNPAAIVRRYDTMCIYVSVSVCVCVCVCVNCVCVWCADKTHRHHLAMSMILSRSSQSKKRQ